MLPPLLPSLWTHHMSTAGLELKHHVVSRLFRSKCSQRTYNVLLLSPGWDFFGENTPVGLICFLTFIASYWRLSKRTLTLAACYKHTCRWTHMHEHSDTHTKTDIYGRKGLYELFPISLSEMSFIVIRRRIQAVLKDGVTMTWGIKVIKLSMHPA